MSKANPTGLGVRPVAAGGVNVCPADSPCISELSITKDGDLFARWTGSYDAFNIRWLNPDVVDNEDVGTNHTSLLRSPDWHRTYQFAVEGCTRHFLSSSTCTPRVTQNIALHAPAAPTNVRVINGEQLTWSINDQLTLGVRVFLRYSPSCGLIDGDDFADVRSPSTTSVSIRDSGCEPINVEAAKVCAVNPAVLPGQGVCSDYVAVASAYQDPTGPELLIRTIRKVDNGDLTAGTSAPYDVVVNNLGRKPDVPVELTIQGSGSVQVTNVLPNPGPDAARNFTCSGTGTITCSGSMGGEGDVIQETIATFRIQVQGVNSGKGQISATVDPNNRIAERDETDNQQSLSVTVK